MPTRVIAFLLLLLLAGVGLPGCGEGDGQEPLPPLPPATDLTVQLVTANLNSPVFMTAPPNDSNRLFVIEKQGLIRIFNVGNSSLATFLDLSHLVSTIGERGLLSMAFDAQYATKHSDIYIAALFSYTDDRSPRWKRCHEKTGNCGC